MPSSLFKASQLLIHPFSIAASPALRVTALTRLSCGKEKNTAWTRRKFIAGTHISMAGLQFSVHPTCMFWDCWRTAGEPAVPRDPSQAQREHVKSTHRSPGPCCDAFTQWQKVFSSHPSYAATKYALLFSKTKGTQWRCFCNNKVEHERNWLVVCVCFQWRTQREVDQLPWTRRATWGASELLLR